MSLIPLSAPAVPGDFNISFVYQSGSVFRLNMYSNNLLGSQPIYQVLMDKRNRLYLFGINPVNGVATQLADVQLSTTPTSLGVNVCGTLIHILANNIAQASASTDSQPNLIPASKIAFTNIAADTYAACSNIPPFPPAPAPTPSNKCCSTLRKPGFRRNPYAKRSIQVIRQSYHTTANCNSTVCGGNTLNHWQKSFLSYTSSC